MKKIDTSMRRATSETETKKADSIHLASPKKTSHRPVKFFFLALLSCLSINASASGFYFDFSGGGLFANDSDFRLPQAVGPFTAGTKTTLEFGTGFALNADVGVKLSDQLSVAISTGYSEIPLDGVRVGATRFKLDGTVSAIPLLVTTILNLPINEDLAAKLGFGIGTSFVNFDSGLGVDDDTTMFTLQWRAGLEQKINDNTSLGLSYRFSLLNDGESIFAHFIGASVILRF